jgi:hypothetical protein
MYTFSVHLLQVTRCWQALNKGTELLLLLLITEICLLKYEMKMEE